MEKKKVFSRDKFQWDAGENGGESHWKWSFIFFGERPASGSHDKFPKLMTLSDGSKHRDFGGFLRVKKCFSVDFKKFSYAL